MTMRGDWLREEARIWSISGGLVSALFASGSAQHQNGLSGRQPGFMTTHDNLYIDAPPTDIPLKARDLRKIQ